MKAVWSKTRQPKGNIKTWIFSRTLKFKIWLLVNKTSMGGELKDELTINYRRLTIHTAHEKVGSISSRLLSTRAFPHSVGSRMPSGLPKRLEIVPNQEPNLMKRSQTQNNVGSHDKITVYLPLKSTKRQRDQYFHENDLNDVVFSCLYSTKRVYGMWACKYCTTNV